MARCTGRHIAKHPEIMQPLMDAVKSGESISSISRRLKLSRDAVRAAKQLPEAGQFAKVTAAKLANLANEVLDSYHKDLKSGKVSANAKPLHAGIFLTKRSECLAENEPKAMV